MKSQDLYNLILNHTFQNSSLAHRPYLGMSRIGYCARELYHDLVQGRQFTCQDHLYCYAGYLHERDMLERLKAIDPACLGPSQEFKDFGGRFQGHTDGEWNGDLLEIKSVASEAYLPSGGRIPRSHYLQVQTYMLYGAYIECKMIYIDRASGNFRVVHIARERRIGELMKLKAASILEAVELGKAPECECGKCNGRENEARRGTIAQGINSR